ncbi:WD40-repeat-containing domain protein [Pyrenochaeta sp. MPI-SDFR-AT-0127]|nr:WD40-repeat-containing domain protein [Pyrenochaeta sp. MPI-SDFR-AT-0127]
MTSSPLILPRPDEKSNSHTGCIFSVRVSTNYIVSGSADGSVRVWSKSEGRLAHPPLLGRPGSAVQGVELSEDLDLVFAGNSKGDIVGWRLSSGERLCTRISHNENVLALALDKTTLVSTSKDQTAIVWKVKCDESPASYLELEHTLEGHNMAVLAVQLSHDCIYTSAGDKSFRIWDRSTGAMIKCLNMNASMAKFRIRNTAVCQQLVGACTDSTIRLYDIVEGVELACLEGHTNVVRSIEVLGASAIVGIAKQFRIASASYDGTVRVWAIQEDKPFSWECLCTLSFSDAVVTPFPFSDQQIEYRVMDIQADENSLYCCGEGAEIVSWKPQFY